jgi:type III secretion system (T3SS) chaperone YscW
MNAILSSLQVAVFTPKQALTIKPFGFDIKVLFATEPTRGAISVILACLVAGSANAQEAGAISSPALSRCAGKVGAETRAADPAFVSLGLDGMPWLTIERVDDTVGSQPISAAVMGTGYWRRRDGTAVPFRFKCALDFSGEALLFHASPLMRKLGDDLAPAIIVEGAATYREKMALPKGVELQVQLLDVSKSPVGEVLAEQVVRSGWRVPIPFALHLPKEPSLAGRKLVVTARLVLAHKVLFQLKEPRAVSGDDLHQLLALTLDNV